MMKRTLALAGVLLLPAAVTAQEERIAEADLPRHVAGEVVEFLNDPGTLQMSGRSRIPEGRVVIGDVGVLGGPVAVAGRVEGRLVVVNGDLELEPGAEVTGDVTVIGGRVRGEEDALIGGTLAVYAEPLRYSRSGSRIVRVEPRDGDRELSLGFGQAKFTVRAGTNYNRVEGLPVLFGPVIETAGSNPFRLEALAVWRSEQGFDFDTDDMGYAVRAEQAVGGWRSTWVGGTLHSTIEPIERWGLSDLEASLATFVLHEDYRDYYEREGWSLFVRYQPPGSPLRLGAEYRREDHTFVRTGGPWSLKDNDEPWRPQPLVAEGNLESLGGEAAWDTRNDMDDPTDGWWVTLRSHAGVGGSLAMPEHVVLAPPDVGPAPIEIVPSRPVETDFVTGFLDARRYLRVSPASSLALRGVLAGSINGESLPSQFQHALGGEGSLPGYEPFSVDCGARSRLVQMQSDPASEDPQFPRYGCDRIALLQVEYRSQLFFDIEFGDDRDEDEDDDGWDWDPHVDLTPSWAVSFDIGRGWSLSDDDAGFTGADTETVKDVGVGLYIGSLGLYWSYPLDGEDRQVNFHVRLHKRF